MFFKIKKFFFSLFVLDEPQAKTVLPVSYPVFVSSRANEIVDAIDHTTGRGAYTGKSEDELRSIYPDLTAMDCAQANEIFDSVCVTPPVEISHEQWLKRLSEAPIREFIALHGVSTFKSRQNVRGSVTMCYVRLDTRAFEFCDYETISHSQIVNKARKRLSQLDESLLESI